MAQGLKILKGFAVNSAIAAYSYFLTVPPMLYNQNNWQCN